MKIYWKSMNLKKTKELQRVKSYYRKDETRSEGERWQKRKSEWKKKRNEHRYENSNKRGGSQNKHNETHIVRKAKDCKITIPYD